MPMNPKTKHGLVYAKPGNCDRARSHEEVAAAALKQAEGVKTGLSHKEQLNPVDEFGYPVIGGYL
jgi:hypothetical protein